MFRILVAASVLWASTANAEMKMITVSPEGEVTKTEYSGGKPEWFTYTPRRSILIVKSRSYLETDGAVTTVRTIEVEASE